ncbi:MAG: restriction endonuclease subunit S [Nostoc sp.]|uniref:restriction endonuclease subunit S n=1 Tax=Nostoc sp. TaxID=1180 RepID=UPI002FEFB0DF
MKLENFFVNFELLTDAPNAVAKLREIILQLAIRGKLVAQHPNDETALALLERIKSKKKQLIFSNKTQKFDFNLSDEEDVILESLPVNWYWTNLETIGWINPRNNLPDDLDVAFIPMNLIPQKYGVVVQWETKKWGDVKKGFTHFAEGDVALAKITPCFQNGKSCVMRGLKNQFGAGTTELHIFRPIDNLTYPEYVLIYFNSVSFIKNAIPIMTGTAGQKRVPNSYVAQNPFPLAPLAEQKRIVEKCDRLLSICDEIEKRQQQRQESIVRMNESAIAQLLSSQNPEEFRQHWQRICNNFDLLYSIPETIPKLRQAILELAVQGKLVRQLPNEEPASKVLQKIKEEKEELAKQGIVVKEKTLASISLDELSFNIPESWIWVRLGQIVKSIRYGTSKHCSYEQNGVPILRIPNLINGKIDQQDLKFTVLSEKELLELKLERNDLLMIRSNGSKSLIGRTAIVSADVEGYGYAGYLVRLKIFLNYVDSRYLNLALDTNFVRYQIEIPIRTTSGVKNINSTEISNLILPLPPLGEQKRIVEKCDRLMSLCDTLEAKLKQGRDSSEKLMEVAAKQLLTA